jgi:hypothetical protein
MNNSEGNTQSHYSDKFVFGIGECWMIKTKMAMTEITVVLMVLMFAFFNKMVTNPFYTDESYWISTSAFFEDWITLDTKKDSWQINFMTLAGPNLPKYFIAVSRLAGGFQPKDLNRTYNYTANNAENGAEGRIPSNDLLLISRIPMAILSVLTGFLMYVLLRKLLNRAFAIVWLIFYIQNLALMQILPMAMSEAPLLFFSFLSLIFILLGQKYWVSFHQNGQLSGDKNKYYSCFASAGVSAGLAASSKIHAFLFVITFGIILFFIIFNLTCNLTRKQKISYLIRIFCLFVFSSLLVFIIITHFCTQIHFMVLGICFGNEFIKWDSKVNNIHGYLLNLYSNAGGRFYINYLPILPPFEEVPVCL